MAPAIEASRLESRASETWNNLPQVGGSRWGFIGVIAGVAVIVLLVLIIGICCCKRRRNQRRRLGHAAQGSDLAALHPTPSFGRNAGNAHRTKFVPLHNDDEDDAFMANSPRNSMSYSGSYVVPSTGLPPHKRGPSNMTEEMTMEEMKNQRYYRGSEGFRNNYSYGNTSYGGDGYEYPSQHGQFVESEYVNQANYGHGYGGASAGYPPSQGAMDASYHDQYASPQTQHPSYEPSHSSVYSTAPPMGPRMPAPHSAISSPHPVPAQPARTNYEPSVAPTESAPPAYIPYNGAGASSGYEQQQRQPPPPPSAEKSRMPGAEV